MISCICYTTNSGLISDLTVKLGLVQILPVLQIRMFLIIHGDKFRLIQNLEQ